MRSHPARPAMAVRPYPLNMKFPAVSVFNGYFSPRTNSAPLKIGTWNKGNLTGSSIGERDAMVEETEDYPYQAQFQPCPRKYISAHG